MVDRALAKLWAWALTCAQCLRRVNSSNMLSTFFDGVLRKQSTCNGAPVPEVQRDHKSGLVKSMAGVLPEGAVTQVCLRCLRKKHHLPGLIKSKADVLQA
eukprot:1154731-Pelagomonas_calceolata.AAC.10